MKVFSVYDSKAEAFMQPFFAMTAGVAIRMFQQHAMDVESNFHKWAADYELFEIGEFEEQHGALTASRAIHSLGNALVLQGESHIGNGPTAITPKDLHEAIQDLEHGIGARHAE